MQIGEGIPCSQQFTVAASPMAVSEGIVGVTATQSGCGYAVLSDSQLVITRNFLPWWCVILAGWMLLFARGWFFFFFSETQERLLVTIASDGHRTRVDLQGRTKPELVGRLHAVLTGFGGQGQSGDDSARSYLNDVATQERAARAIEQAEMERLTKKGSTGSATVTCTPNGRGLRCSGIITAGDGSAAEKTWDVEVAPHSDAVRWSAPTVRVIPPEPLAGCPRCSAPGTELAWCDGCAARLSALRQLPPSDFLTAFFRDMDDATAEGHLADFIDQRFSPRFKGHLSNRPAPMDKTRYRAIFEQITTAFPDMLSESFHIVEDGDRVWSQCHLHAQGAGGTYELHGVAACRMTESLVVESWSYPGLQLPDRPGARIDNH
jgi:hypothetical protein